MNGGWIQTPARMSRQFDFKTNELTQFGSALQQRRFPASRLQDEPGQAHVSLVMLAGAKYSDPELSWLYESGPDGALYVMSITDGAIYEIRSK
jgi:hypothetical protein